MNVAIQDLSVSEAQENERQDIFIRRKLAVLSSRQSDSKTGNFTEQNKDEELVGRLNFVVGLEEPVKNLCHYVISHEIFVGFNFREFCRFSNDQQK